MFFTNEYVFYIMRNFKDVRFQIGVCRFPEKAEILEKMNQFNKKIEWEFVASIRDYEPKYPELLETYFNIKVRKQKKLDWDDACRMVDLARSFDLANEELKEEVYGYFQLLTPKQAKERERQTQIELSSM